MHQTTWGESWHIKKSIIKYRIKLELAVNVNATEIELSDNGNILLCFFSMNIVEYNEFYNVSLDHMDLMAEYYTWQNPDRPGQFSFCQVVTFDTEMYVA